MNLVSLLNVVMVVSAGQLPPLEPPPLPDFKEPVNYAAWYHRQMRFAHNNNALDMYGTFLYGADDAPPPAIAPPPRSKAAAQLKALLASPEPWHPAKQPELAAWTERIEARYLAGFTHAVKRRYFACRKDPYLILLGDLRLPKLANGRTIGQMMFARAWAVTGSTLYTDRFVEAVLTSIVYANHVGCGLSSDEQFFAAGVRSFVYEQLGRTLSRKTHTSDVWRDVLKILEERDAVPVTQYYARSMYFAEATALQLIQHFCTKSGPGGRDTLSPKIELDTVKAYLQSHPGGARWKPQDLERLAAAEPVVLCKAIHEYYESLRKLLMASQVTDLPGQIRKIEAKAVGQHPALKPILAPVSLSVQLSFRDEATRRLVRVLLKMAVKFKDTGKWPATLDELAGPGMEQCRIDPFTGKDLILKPLGPRTAPYSVGPNGVDDEGSPQKDVVFWTNVAEDPSAAAPPPPTSQPTEEADKRGDSKDNKDAPDTPPPGSGSA